MYLRPEFESENCEIAEAFYKLFHKNGLFVKMADGQFTGSAYDEHWVMGYTYAVFFFIKDDIFSVELYNVDEYEKAKGKIQW